jgi:hypothetical protein
MKRIPLGAPGALLLGAVAFSAAALVACGGGAASPTAAPTPAPTPVPVASATPDPNVPPAGSACGKPYPPPISRLSEKNHLKDNDYWTIDSTPLVGPDGEYCYAVGFTDGRTICPLRPEGAEDRAACETWRGGIAKDGISGPTWTHIEYGTGMLAGPIVSIMLTPDLTLSAAGLACGLKKRTWVLGPVRRTITL